MLKKILTACALCLSIAGAYAQQNVDPVVMTVGDEPERFDVVVCNHPDRLAANGSRLNFAKRVVGLPGDTVEIRGGYLYVNGMKQEEKFLHERMNYNFGPVVVQEGHYFLMGDNRNNSNDSRYAEIGFVDSRCVLGKVILRLSPFTFFF